jgi:hypothetical protein
VNSPASVGTSRRSRGPRAAPATRRCFRSAAEADTGSAGPARPGSAESCWAPPNGLGAAERTERRLHRTGAERALHLACGVLERVGCQPYRDDEGAVRLPNCPVHPLAARRRDLVSGMNRELIEGGYAGWATQRSPPRPPADRTSAGSSCADETTRSDRPPARPRHRAGPEACATTCHTGPRLRAPCMGDI